MTKRSNNERTLSHAPLCFRPQGELPGLVCKEIFDGTNNLILRRSTQIRMHEQTKTLPYRQRGPMVGPISQPIPKERVMTRDEFLQETLKFLATQPYHGQSAPGEAVYVGNYGKAPNTQALFLYTVLMIKFPIPTNQEAIELCMRHSGYIPPVDGLRLPTSEEGKLFQENIGRVDEQTRKNSLSPCGRGSREAGGEGDMTMKTINEAKRVLTAEAQALTTLAEKLDSSFTAAIEKLKSVTGRVIVSGMGKSGHIARKIAATLASTGTPAQFVHPAEASHGDLGMITAADAVIALSNSGNTPELANLIAYTRRFSIPLIAITAGTDSELSRHADVALLLPQLPEACPLELAPMTSTTMMLALGDAIAAALMAAQNFTADHFKNYHPGGKLGHKLLKVSELMHGGDELPLCGASTNMKDVLVLMSSKGFGCVGIAETEKLIGIITDGDLRRHMNDGLLSQSAVQIMTPNPRSIAPTALAAEALAILNEKNITTLFVVDAGRAVGILHIHDLLRAGVI